MAGSSIVKKTAKTALKNKWPKCIITSTALVIAFIVPMLSIGIISSAIGKIATLILEVILLAFISLPLGLGALRYFWRLLFNADDNLIVLFYYFSDKKLYIRAISLILNIGIRGLLFGSALYAPAILVDVFSDAGVYERMNISIPVWTSNFWMLSVILKTIATVILFFIVVRYYLAPVLVIADEDMDIGEAIHMSSVISRRTNMDFIYLFFSFIGWLLLSVFVFADIFTLPYIITSYLVHVRFAISQYNEHTKNINNVGMPTFAAGA